MPLLCLVGASNELPESDELDALYDRFLLRTTVVPVSEAGLDALLALPAPFDLDGNADAADTVAADAAPALSLRVEAMGAVRRAASHVALPNDIKMLLTELLAQLKKRDPPVYVSGA